MKGEIIGVIFINNLRIKNTPGWTTVNFKTNEDKEKSIKAFRGKEQMTHKD